MSPLATLSFLVIAIWPLAGAAEQPSHTSLRACELLTAAELETAVGGSVAQQSGSEKPYRKNPMIDHDGILSTCSETVGARKVTVVFNTAPVTAEGKRFAETGAKGAESALHEEGYQVQAKEIRGSRCMTILPPAGSKSTADTARLGTNCTREKGPYVVSITIGPAGSGDALSMEKVAALAEKAASRVPPQ